MREENDNKEGTETERLHRDCRQSEDLAMLLQTEEECRVLGLVSKISNLVKNIVGQFFSYLRNSSVSLMLILFGPSMMTLVMACGTCNRMIVKFSQ